MMRSELSQQNSFWTTRRQLLRSGATLFVATHVAAACDLFTTDPTESDPSAGNGSRDTSEAPILAERVAAGELPPLDERLPRDPLTVEPVNQIGTYGGTWTSAIHGPTDTAMLYRTIGYDQLMTWDRDFTEALPNIAEEIEVGENGQQFVIHLRAGMKWSDGEDFTADDIVFAYEDVVSNAELHPTFPDWLSVHDEPGILEKIDNTTVRFSFAEPNGWFFLTMAAPTGETLTIYPRHYLEQFHSTYNPDVAQTAADEGYADWVAFFHARADRWTNRDLPTLNAWLITEPLAKGTRVVAERNPFYWKTDPDGSQLPYIDRVVFEIVDDEEVMLLKATNGEFSMHDRYFNTATNKPILAKGREQGDYEFFEKTALPNEMVISLNLTHEDQMLREVFQNKDFRIGLSLAINRQEVIDAAFQRRGRPWQAAPRGESPLFDEEMATQYTEYDVDLANEYLDRAGYSDRDDDGFRVGPDGTRISFQVDIADVVQPAWSPALELIASYWQEVGIEMRPNGLDRALFFERRNSNLNDAQVWWVGGDGNALLGAMLAPDFYVPIRPWFASAWARWYSNSGDPMEEPPAEVREQFDLFDQARMTTNPGERADLFRRVLRIAKDSFYTMGIVMSPDAYGIVKNNFHNVPEPMGETWRGVTPGRSRPEQYYVSA